MKRRIADSCGCTPVSPAVVPAHRLSGSVRVPFGDDTSGGHGPGAVPLVSLSLHGVPFDQGRSASERAGCDAAGVKARIDNGKSRMAADLSESLSVVLPLPGVRPIESVFTAESWFGAWKPHRSFARGLTCVPLRAEPGQAGMSAFCRNPVKATQAT